MTNKYKIGDVLYYLENDEILSEEVSSIVIQKDCVIYNLNERIKKKESKVFPSPKDLIHNLEVRYCDPSFSFVNLALPSGTLWADRNAVALNPGHTGNYYTIDEARELGYTIPSVYQIYELINHCRWIPSMQNEHRGYKVIDINGNSIFLPTTGYIQYTKVIDLITDGCYWSDTSDKSNNKQYCLNFLLDYKEIRIYSLEKDIKRCVRFVKNLDIKDE